jgi:MFS transporter, AAHS family, 3-hydroxyphenylpropionic acid transporter
VVTAVSSTSTTLHDPISATQVRVVALCALVTLIEGIDLTLIPLLAPKITEAWSVSAAEFGIILSSGPIGLIIGGLGVGYLADRIGRRNALIAAMLLMTVATAATVLATNVSQLLFARLVTGISFGGVIPVAVALVSESLPARVRASVVAFVFLGQAGGGLLAALLLKLPIAAGPWQTPVLYVAGGCAVVTVMLMGLLPESPRFLNLSGPRNRLRDLFSDGRAMGTALIWATFIGVCFAVSFFTNWLTLILTHAGKPSDVGVDAIAVYSAGAMLGGLVLPLFARRWHTNMVLLASIIGAVASCIGIGLVLPMSNGVILVMAAVCGIFVSGAFFMLYPPAARFYPTHIRSTGIGAAVAFGRIGNMLSPAAAGFMLGAGIQPATVFYAIAAPMVLSCVTLVVFHRRTASDHSADTLD